MIDDNPLDFSHRLIEKHRALVLRALDGETEALAQLICEVYRTGEVDGIVLGTKATTATLAKSS